MHKSEFLGIELIVQDVRGRVQGHVVDLDHPTLSVEGCSHELEHGPVRRNRKTSSFLSRGHATADLLSEPDGLVAKIGEPCVDPAWSRFGLRDWGASDQRLRQIRGGKHDWPAVHRVAATSDATCLFVGQPQDASDVFRRRDVLVNVDLVDVRRTVIVGRPDGLPRTPAVAPQAVNATTPDRPERLDEHARAFAGVDEPLSPQQPKSLPDREWGYAEVSCQRVLARQSITGLILPAVDRGSQVVRDALVLRPGRLVAHGSPCLSIEPIVRAPRFVGGTTRRCCDSSPCLSIELLTSL
ncbi:hypothetical protein SAMN05216499_14146 [Actinacidiphila paucisporea]|uniref:Uncharacterized protein n=1 Tax=Actinacidiphila paucisporea TaxID=310782 RepID=A0A1M7QTA9_9ACTN|nr:hypothetical protein SAMN05216499_14146 [Actinacidiphila paucisporea]